LVSEMGNVGLQPSSVYFTAIAGDFQVGSGLEPVTPYLLGNIDITGRNFLIPNDFTTSSIDNKWGERCIAIALSNDDGEGGILRSGARKSGISIDRQPRWIIPRTDGEPGLMTVPVKVTPHKPAKKQ